MKGVCGAVNTTHWLLTEDGATELGAGRRATPGPSAAVELVFVMGEAKLMIDGATAAEAAVAARAGMVGLQSSWDRVGFDNFTLA